MLNSKLLNFLYSLDNPQKGKTFAEIKPSVVKDLPIKNIENEKQLQFIQKANLMLELTQKSYSLAVNQLYFSIFPSESLYT